MLAAVVYVVYHRRQLTGLFHVFERRPAILTAVENASPTPVGAYFGHPYGAAVGDERKVGISRAGPRSYAQTALGIYAADGGSIYPHSGLGRLTVVLFKQDNSVKHKRARVVAGKKLVYRAFYHTALGIVFSADSYAVAVGKENAAVADEVDKEGVTVFFSGAAGF